jgi:hypothetical protein
MNGTRKLSAILIAVPAERCPVDEAVALVDPGQNTPTTAAIRAVRRSVGREQEIRTASVIRWAPRARND